MQKKTINISVPQSMADFIEREVACGEYASTSDFFRVLVREYQARRGRAHADEEIGQGIRLAREQMERGEAQDGREAMRELRAEGGREKLEALRSEIAHAVEQADSGQTTDGREVFDRLREKAADQQ